MNKENKEYNLCTAKMNRMIKKENPPFGGFFILLLHYPLSHALRNVI